MLWTVRNTEPAVLSPQKTKDSDSDSEFRALQGKEKTKKSRERAK